MDKIVVYSDDGTREEMEVVTIYEMSNRPFHYIIYRSFQDEYYVGKYMGDQVVDLDTDLDALEMKYAEGILEGLVGR